MHCNSRAIFLNRYEGDGETPTSEYGLGRDSILNVLSQFQQNKYIISQVPEPMERDIAIPPCLQCGFFKHGIQVHYTSFKYSNKMTIKSI